MLSLTSLKHAVTIGLVLVLPCHGLTYWIDGTCGTQLVDSIPQGISMANRANARLANAADTDMADYFKRIFKVDKTDTASVTRVAFVEGGIAGFTQIQDRAQSDIRIYCDNDERGPGKRWTEIAGSGGLDWVDSLNHVRMSRTTKGCQDSRTQGETFDLIPHNAPATERAGRSTITICKMQLDAAMQTLPALQKDVTALANLDAFEAVTSLVIQHEFTHVPAYDTVDEPKGYKWVPINALSNTQALNNADSYAYFGLLAILGDRGFRLSKRNNEAAAGRIVKATTTAKRSITKSRNNRKMKLRWIDDMGFFGSGGKVFV